ncbi:unnamed protein product [Prunus armeniaca]|uniref:Protein DETOXIFICATION n=1 Tax=Prunus armeniaca TaxID=36596 RepID=A0A6J5UV27_PRUAR|nr:unnamed protein product [Prunus armeniaca]
MDQLAPLIPENPKLEQENQKTHLSLALIEAKCIANIAFPMVLTGLLLYSRTMISMLFLGRLGELALAGGSLAIGFANITGYSVLSGLAMGMEPICGQAYGAKRFKLLGLTLQRTVILLLLTSIPIALLWFNMKRILLSCGQQDDIATQAQSYIFYSLPDLIAQSLLHPLRIYLRSQSITVPLTFCATLAILLHIPINYLLVCVLNLGIKGVALSGVWTNVNLVGSLIFYIAISGVYKKTWGGFSKECFEGWKSLMNLAIPSCISVCLEWWCVGVSTRVGNELGANRPERAKLATIVGLSYSFILGFSALLFAVTVRNIWASMYTQDSEIITLTSMVLPIIGLCELGNCPQTTGCGVLRGTARPKLGANINLGCFYLVGMPVAVWLGFLAGFDFRGLWLGLLAAQGSCVVTMLFVLARTNWELQAQRAKELTGTFTIDDQDAADEAYESLSSLQKAKCDNSLV